MSLVAAQLQFAQRFSYAATCARVRNILDHLPPRLRTDREFGDTAAIDLFVLQDYKGNQLSFVNILDLASTFGVVVAMIPSKHPKIVWDHFFKHWITPFGVPRRLIYDQGGEFEREFGQELEDLGCELMPTAAMTPQQNAVCERHGGIWKTHARRLLDEFSVKFVPEQLHRVTWLTVSFTWACKSASDDSGGTLLRSGFSDGDCDCHTRCWTRQEDFLCTNESQEIEHSLNSSR